MVRTGNYFMIIFCTYETDILLWKNSGPNSLATTLFSAFGATDAMIH